MNPIVKRHLGEIETAVDQLRHRLEHSNQLVLDTEAERDDLRKENWRQSKELATLRRQAANYKELQDDNATLRDQRSQLQEHLLRILNHTKALAEEFRQ